MKKRLCRGRWEENQFREDVTKKYRMKKFTALMAGVFCVLLSCAQANIEKETSKIIQLVERNVTTDGRTFPAS